MVARFLVFIGVAAIVIVVPGPDTAVVTKNVLARGRRTALGTSLGVSAGLAVWRSRRHWGSPQSGAHPPWRFTIMKLVGALYLVWLAARAADTLPRPRVKAAMDRITGTVLIALGRRLATEHR